MKPIDEVRWWRRHFLDVAARDVADRAIDPLPLSAPMSVYIDVWVAAYLRAGGTTPLVTPQPLPQSPR